MMAMTMMAAKMMARIGLLLASAVPQRTGMVLG
jgi:hypothetical protein